MTGFLCKVRKANLNKDKWKEHILVDKIQDADDNEEGTVKCLKVGKKDCFEENLLPTSTVFTKVC